MFFFWRAVASGMNNRLLAGLAFTTLTACASTPTPTPPAATTAPTTTWYAGTVTVTSPDGATPYGPPQPALIARTVDTATNLEEKTGFAVLSPR